VGPELLATQSARAQLAFHRVHLAQAGPRR